MMKKLVKLLKGRDALDLDGIDDYDDLAVDNYSQDDWSLASDDVSNYDGEPKATPVEFTLDPNDARKCFNYPATPTLA